KLRERAGGADLSTVNHYELLSDLVVVPKWPFAQLGKPRDDWIVENGHYAVFGENWPIKEGLTSLAELEGHQLYPADPSVGRRPALRFILRSMLVRYSHLLDALLAPPPTAPSTGASEWEQQTEWINILAQNVMAAANDMRPVQARGKKLMMRQQLELRNEETKAIHAQCDTLEAKMADMRAEIQRLPHASTGSSRKPVIFQGGGGDKILDEDDSRWAEEI
ncbi:uncharacterized protein LAESUDRAFT_730918, partial [Laetiporus sulphureus 93-53]